MNDQKRSGIVERYDSRKDTWTIISDDKENVDNTYLTTSIHLNESIYCFSSVNKGSIFDIRANKWRGNTSAVMAPKTEITYL